LPNGKEIFRFRLPKRLSDKISEMTVGDGAKVGAPISQGGGATFFVQKIDGFKDKTVLLQSYKSK